jgi:single-strand DNA-binding protein
MANSTNLVVLSGYIGSVSDIRHTPNEKSVMDFSIAVKPSPRKDKAGNWLDQKPLWFKVVCWNGTGEYATERARAGGFVEVQGTIVTPQVYESKKTGEPACQMVINASSLNFIDVVKSDKSRSEFDDDF